VASLGNEATVPLYDALTKTRTFAVFQDDLKQALIPARTKYGARNIRGVAAGAPGRLSHDRSRITLTLVDWGREIPLKEKIRELTGAENVLLLNDLETGAAGIFDAETSHLHKISAHDTALPQGPDFDLILGMPGTGHGIGLYLAGLWTRPTEGGGRSVPLNPSSPEERTVIARAARDLSSPNKENQSLLLPTFDDLVSGSGMVKIKDALLESEAFAQGKNEIQRVLDRESSRDPAEAISSLASGRELVPGREAAQKLCRDTLELFCRFFARGMRDAALIFLPQAVFLGGLIVEKNHLFIEKFFMKEFLLHHHHAYYLSSLPVFYLKGELDLNLKGGLRLLRKILGQAPAGRREG
jgi:glucokinase